MIRSIFVAFAIAITAASIIGVPSADARTYKRERQYYYGQYFTRSRRQQASTAA